MKTGLAYLKPWAGLFFEALMLTFIFVYAHADFTVDTHSSMNGPRKADECLQQMTFRAAISTESTNHILPGITFTSLIKTFSAIDLAGLKVTLSKALTIGHSERKYFYDQLTDNAP